MDPSYSDTATIGGIVAANSSGPRRLLYNLPRDMILGVRFVTPDGDVVGAGGKTVKNVSGYDTSKLMVGSMGSLGILCEMTFRLLPLPEQMETLLFTFDAFSDACRLADGIFETGLLPAAVEVMNGTAFAGLKVGRAAQLEPGGYVVAVALEAFESAVARMVKEIRNMAGALGAKQDASLEDQEHLQFWLAVSNLTPSLRETFPNVIRAKLNYPISEWKHIFEFVENRLSPGKIEHAILTHAGSGICSIHLLWDQDNNGSSDHAVEAMGQLLAHCREAGGNLVIQSAPGDLKKRLNIWGESGSDFILMKQIKEQVDPLGILSPGRFIGGL